MSSVKIRGHERPISILLNSIKSNHLASSYLFVGPEGIGKSLVAKYFAQALNCEKNNFEACGVCASCQKIGSLNHPDVHWITGICSACKKFREDSDYINEYSFVSECSGCDRSKNFTLTNMHMVNTEGRRSIRIVQIRRLIEQINLRLLEGKHKVFIILDADKMEEEAANCLLKTLEEPPNNSLIILITSQIKRLFPTIVSRCQRINFSALSPVALEGILMKDYNFPAEESHYLSFSSEGRLGESLRLNNPNILREKNQVINEFLNLSGRGYFTDQIFEDKDKQKQLLIILMQWFRDIMFLKSGVDAASLINIDRKNDLLKLKERYSFEEVALALKDIAGAYALFEQNLNVKITLSLLREKLCKS